MLFVQRFLRNKLTLERLKTEAENIIIAEKIRRMKSGESSNAATGYFTALDVAWLEYCSSSAPAPAVVTPALVPAPTRIVIGLDDNFPPIGFRDEKSELVGFDIDLAKEAGKRLGITVTFKPIDWTTKEAELSSKKIDVLWNGLTITEERKANILFTKPYLANRQIIVVTDKSSIKAKADLKGKVVGVQAGSTAVDAVQKEVTLAKSLKKLKEFGGNETALNDLSAGRMDALVVDEVIGRYYASRKPGKYRILEENFGTEDYAIGTRKDDTDLMGKIDKAMDDMKTDGTAANISTKWFGKDIIKR